MHRRANLSTNGSLVHLSLIWGPSKVLHPFPEGSRQPSHSLVIMCISLGSTVIFPKSEMAMLSSLTRPQEPCLLQTSTSTWSGTSRTVSCFNFSKFTLWKREQVANIRFRCNVLVLKNNLLQSFSDQARLREQFFGHVLPHFKGHSKLWTIRRVWSQSDSWSCFKRGWVDLSQRKHPAEPTPGPFWGANRPQAYLQALCHQRLFSDWRCKDFCFGPSDPD